MPGCLFRKGFHSLHTAPNAPALRSICSHACYLLNAPKCSPCTDAHCCALLRQDGAILARSCHFPRSGQIETEKFWTSRPFVWLLAELSRAGGMAAFRFCSTVLREQRLVWKKSKARPRGGPMLPFPSWKMKTHLLAAACLSWKLVWNLRQGLWRHDGFP